VRKSKWGGLVWESQNRYTNKLYSTLANLYPNDIESSTVGGSSGGLGTSDRTRNVGFTAGQGNQGGLGRLSGEGVGGGGGAGNQGGEAPNGTGGIGLQIDITGTNTYYSGGGGRGHTNGGTSGGLGGGGGATLTVGSNATSYGGGGGGGGTNFGGGGSGYAGVVIIRYKFNVPSVIIGTVINDSYKHLTFLNTGSNETKYTIILPQEIEIQILLLNNVNYRELDVPFDISFGTFELIVGKNGLHTSFAQVSTGVNGTAISSGRVSNITGTNVTYNSPIAIIRYRNKKTEIVQIEVDGLLKYTKDNGWLIDTAINDTIISNTSLIAILQSQMIQVFATLAAKSINAVYEWATDNSGWKIIEANNQIFLPNGNFQIRLRSIDFFGNNTVSPHFITVEDTRRNTGAVTNTYTTYNSSDVVLYGRHQSTATQHDMKIRISDNEGFTSAFFKIYNC